MEKKTNTPKNAGQWSHRAGESRVRRQGEQNAESRVRGRGEQDAESRVRRQGEQNAERRVRRRGEQDAERRVRRQGEQDGERRPKGQDSQKNGQRHGMNVADRAVCPAAKRCGGCTMQGIPYKKQLRQKQQKVGELLADICPVIHPVTGMDQPEHYRNKTHAVFGYERGKIISGTYEEGTHCIIPVDECMIENETADAIIRDVRKLLPSFKIKVYDEDSGYGLLRHMLVRTGLYSGEVMVVLVTASPILPAKNQFVKALRALHPEITTIVLNVNEQRTSMVLGPRNIVLYGKGYIEDRLCGCSFRISPSSFYQVNPKQAQLLYEKAVELAALTGRERLIDAYCGTGTIGIVAAKKAGEVIGIELNQDAVRDAVANAKRNAVKNIRFYQADAGEFMVGMAQSGEPADVVILDPPRSGVPEAFIRAVSRLSPERVVYISCNPETLARDLRIFRECGYQAKEAWPYDMFPFTGHVETVCLLAKLNVGHDIDMELNLTVAGSKAIYGGLKNAQFK